MKNFKADETFKATSALNLSMMYRDSPNYPVKNSWMLWSELEKNQNVTFKRTDIPLSDYPQKRSTLIAAGQTPDIVTGVAPGEEKLVSKPQQLWMNSLKRLKYSKQNIQV